MSMGDGYLVWYEMMKNNMDTNTINNPETDISWYRRYSNYISSLTSNPTIQTDWYNKFSNYIHSNKYNSKALNYTTSLTSNTTTSTSSLAAAAMDNTSFNRARQTGVLVGNMEASNEANQQSQSTVTVETEPSSPPSQKKIKIETSPSNHSGITPPSNRTMVSFEKDDKDISIVKVIGNHPCRKRGSRLPSYSSSSNTVCNTSKRVQVNTNSTSSTSSISVSRISTTSSSSSTPTRKSGISTHTSTRRRRHPSLKKKRNASKGYRGNNCKNRDSTGDTIIYFDALKSTPSTVTNTRKSKPAKDEHATTIKQLRNFVKDKKKVEPKCSTRLSSSSSRLTTEVVNELAKHPERNCTGKKNKQKKIKCHNNGNSCLHCGTWKCAAGLEKCAKASGKVVVSSTESMDEINSLFKKAVEITRAEDFSRFQHELERQQITTIPSLLQITPISRFKIAPLQYLTSATGQYKWVTSTTNGKYDDKHTNEVKRNEGHDVKTNDDERHKLKKDDDRPRTMINGVDDENKVKTENDIRQKVKASKENELKTNGDDIKTKNNDSLKAKDAELNTNNEKRHKVVTDEPTTVRVNGHGSKIGTKPAPNLAVAIEKLGHGAIKWMENEGIYENNAMTTDTNKLQGAKDILDRRIKEITQKTKGKTSEDENENTDAIRKPTLEKPGHHRNGVFEMLWETETFVWKVDTNNNILNLVYKG